jgi:RNA polymerase sigma-70 factor (ECF subfamily)
MTVCRRYGRTQQEAEDMLQESFIKIFSNLQSFNSTGSLYGWLKSITVNTSIKILQKRYNKIVSEDIDAVYDQSVEQNFHYDLHAEDLLAIISQLPVGYNSVFNLYEIEGYSHKEIGDLLNISESTSRSQLAKAKKILRSLIPKNQRYAV